MTDYHEPRTIDEACELLHRYGEDARVLAGGTALVLFMRQGLLDPACLINIQYLSELAGIESRDSAPPSESSAHRPESLIRLGALTTHSQASDSPLIRERYPALTETFRHVATPRIRNAGTVGGNLAHGDPHLDPPVTLLALDAIAVAQSTGGQRSLPLTSFFRDYYETALATDEILTQVLLPPLEPRSGAAFIKFLPRSQDDYATVDVAAWVQFGSGSDREKLADVRIALGSVGPTPFRALEAEGLLRNERIGDEVLAEAGERAAAACDPEDDVRGSAAYKREVVKVVVRRAVRQAMENARNGEGDPA